MSPVLFTVAGTRAGEAVVIERCPEDYAHREPEDGVVCVTNHYVTDEYEDDNADLDELDTVERPECLEDALEARKSMDPAKALRILGHDDLLGDDTQHQVVMRPADGTLVVKVPGSKTVTVQTQSHHP